jgi:hypothetical protein
MTISVPGSVAIQFILQYYGKYPISDKLKIEFSFSPFEKSRHVKTAEIFSPEPQKTDAEP